MKPLSSGRSHADGWLQKESFFEDGDEASEPESEVPSVAPTATPVQTIEKNRFRVVGTLLVVNFGLADNITRRKDTALNKTLLVTPTPLDPR